MTRKVLWRPSDERRDASTMQKYINWLSINHGLEFSNYDQLWSWSVSDLNFFWQTIWDYFQLKSASSFERPLKVEKMPGAEWFSGASLNFLDGIFRHSETCPAKSVPPEIGASQTLLFTAS